MRHVLMIAVALVSLSAVAQHHPGGARAGDTATDWTRAPLLLAAGRGRTDAPVRLKGLSADRVTVFAPGGPAQSRVRQMPVEAGIARITPAAPMMGNYHWVQAREVTDTMVHVASTVAYFANPGDAPTALLRESHSELEIVPTPLPREHARYRESERWPFLVRWQGQPLAGQALILETANGSRSRVVTDDAGIATVVFPRDFDPAALADRAGHDRATAAFVLSTEHRDGGIHYLTAFNQTYSPEPARSRSLAWGAGFGLLGMALATPLLRRREPRHD